MNDVKVRAELAHEIVMQSICYDDVPLASLIRDYKAFPCWLCGKPMDQERGECHARCMAEETAGGDMPW